MVTVTRPGPVAPADSPTTPTGTPPSPRAVRRLLSMMATTPGRLRLASVIMVAAVVLMWVVLATTLRSRQAAARQVGRETEPLLVAVEQVDASLADADATAANGFLTGGLEPASLSARYDSDIKVASNRLADVTRRVGTSSAALAAASTVTEELPVYTGLVERARANNRQNFPVGAAYLRDASKLMRLQILPATNRLYAAESARLDRGYQSGRAGLDVGAVVVVGAVALAGLVVTQLYLLRRSNRIINVPLLGATILVVLIVGWVVLAFSGESSQLAAARVHGSQPVELLTQARLDALRAESDESLTMVGRGGSQQYSKDFDAAVSQLRGVLGQAQQRGAATGNAVALLDSYLAIHQVVQTEAATDFTKAVQLVVGTAPGDEGPAFARLDAQLSAGVTANQDQFARHAASAQAALGGLTGLALGLSILIGLLALFGAQQRINDFR